jgi:hypothetical protein
VPNGTAIFSAECQKCIGGTTGIDKCPTDSLKKIMKTKNDCLTDSQISILNKSFNEYLRPVQKDPDPMFKVSDTVKCMRNLLYKKIEASGKKIGFCINHTLIANAVYRPESEDVLFTTESTLGDDRVLGHELFHVYQDTHYLGGIKQYQTGKVPVGFPNIEFEQALFNDIVNRKRDAMNNGSGKIKEEYKDWLDTITRNNTTQPKQFSDLLGKYNYFLEQFHKYPPYNDGIIHTSLLPNALLTFFSTSNCR